MTECHCPWLFCDRRRPGVGITTEGKVATSCRMETCDSLPPRGCGAPDFSPWVDPRKRCSADFLRRARADSQKVNTSPDKPLALVLQSGQSCRRMQQATRESVDTAPTRSGGGSDGGG